MTDREPIESIRSRVDRLRAARGGLGDAVAAGLSAVGITPERVSRITGRPCGCKQRQQALNDLSAWIERKLLGH